MWACQGLTDPGDTAPICRSLWPDQVQRDSDAQWWAHPWSIAILSCTDCGEGHSGEGEYPLLGPFHFLHLHKAQSVNKGAPGTSGLSGGCLRAWQPFSHCVFLPRHHCSRCSELGRSELSETQSGWPGTSPNGAA